MPDEGGHLHTRGVLCLREKLRTWGRGQPPKPAGGAGGATVAAEKLPKAGGGASSGSAP